MEGHEFDIQAMFDRVDHPARVDGGAAMAGARTTIVPGMMAAPMNGKGKQFVAARAPRCHGLPRRCWLRPRQV